MEVNLKAEIKPEIKAEAEAVGEVGMGGPRRVQNFILGTETMNLNSHRSNSELSELEVQMRYSSPCCLTSIHWPCSCEQPR